MPDDVVIRVENLSKQYRIGGGPRAGYKTIRETIVDAVKAPLQRLSSSLSAPGSSLSSTDDTIWALKDVSFEVKRGEVVGIIGQNGAGKSTLLKILSKITEPTEGRVELRGRVGSLLEVVTGFHPELTGHENVYMYGAILGMDRWEVTRKFDEIVAFAELEKFIETPVKRYSTGMYMRLAFAVAAHMETEILLVDEVLAVGDMAFQKKCLGKMGDVSREGRTVLLVSHNMAAIRKLCYRSILLKEGIIVRSGATDSVIADYHRDADRYTQLGPYNINIDLFKDHQSKDGLPVTITDIELLNVNRKTLEVLSTGDGLIVQISFHAKRKIIAPAFFVFLYDSYGTVLARFSTMPISGYFIQEIEGKGTVELLIEELPLTGGLYYLSLGITRPNVDTLINIEKALSLYITPRDVYKSGLPIDSSRGGVHAPYYVKICLKHSTFKNIT